MGNASPQTDPSLLSADPTYQYLQALSAHQPQMRNEDILNAMSRLLNQTPQPSPVERIPMANMLLPLMGGGMQMGSTAEAPPLTPEQSKMGVAQSAPFQPVADVAGILAGSTRQPVGQAVLASERGAIGEAGIGDVFHGSHQQLTAMQSRPVEKLSSFGTWFTSSPEVAKGTYGPNVTRSKLGSLRLKEMPVPADFDTQLIDPELARATGHTAEAKVLSKSLPNNRELLDLNRSEFFTPQQARRIKELSEAKKAAGNLYRSPKYMQALRKKFQSEGYDGLVWKQSRLDLRSGDPGTHDAYVVFHDKDIPAEVLP